MALFEELKRRNVVRMATLYVVASWVILQVADILFDAFELEASANRLVIIILLLGFPVALVVSWVYELTPDGVKRESEIDRDNANTRRTDRKVNGLIVGLLALAVVMLGANLLRQGGSAPDSTVAGSVSELSIAVLPFANRSANADDVYFVDGVHDDILTQLVRIGSLTVTSRTSVERFRDTTLSIPEIAAQLGVRHILEGGIQRAGNRVRINLQLINARNDDHLWAETYERELTAANIFDVQADIARAVTSALSVTLQTTEEAALAERPTDSIEAYDLYLLGRFHWNKRTPEAIELSQGYFERATQTDPEYVLAFSGLADSYSLLVDYGNLPGEEGFLLAQAAIDKAMELDDTVSEVWASLGLLRLQQDRDQDAIDALQRAIDLDEKNFWAWSWYGTVVQGQRRFREAQSAMEAAYALEPMAIPVNNNLAFHYEYQGDFIRARQHFERVAELRPESAAQVRTDIAETYQAEGRLSTAIQNYRELLSEDASNIRAISRLGETYLLLGDMTEAAAWYARLNELASLNNSKYLLYEADGDYEAAMVYLEDYLVRFGNRQDIATLALLFRAAYLGGYVEQASEYYKERLALVNADIEISPWNPRQFDGLLIAEFLMQHGKDHGLDAATGESLLASARSALTSLRDEGMNPPDLYASLAVVEAMDGNASQALAALEEAVDRGFRDLRSVQNFQAVQALADAPQLVAIQARVQSELDSEVASLITLALAPVAEFERQPIELGLETLKTYVGYFTDGNVVAEIQLEEEGLVVSVGQQGPRSRLLAYDTDKFFSPVFKGGSLAFGRDEEGIISHVEWRLAGDVDRMKVAPPPPPAVTLPRALLESYQGTYAWLRPGTSGDMEADYWVAQISVDEDDTVWLDLDDQPRLEMVAYAEQNFFVPGFIQRFEFVFEAEASEASKMIFKADGREMDFLRR